MIVYDNVTKRNMRFAILLNETELAILKASTKLAIEIAEDVEPNIEDLVHLSEFKKVYEKLENPVVKPRTEGF